MICRLVAPATYLGYQEGLPAFGGRPAVPGLKLWNLTAAVGEHPEGSTVSTQTLHAHGYQTPAEHAASMREVQLRRQKVKDTHQPFSGGAGR